MSLLVVCVKLSSGRKSVTTSRRVDKQPAASESGSSLAVSSSRRRQPHFVKSTRKRPAEVLIVNVVVTFKCLLHGM